MATGWTWDYLRWQVDLPQLEAMNRLWRDFPPMQVQLARLSRFLGMEQEQKSDAVTSDQQEAQAAQLLEMFPVQPMPEIMSAEEYLAQKALQEGGHV